MAPNNMKGGDTMRGMSVCGETQVSKFSFEIIRTICGVLCGDEWAC